MIPLSLIVIINMPLLGFLNTYLIKKVQDLRAQKYGDHVITEPKPIPAQWRYFLWLGCITAYLFALYFLRNADWLFDLIFGLSLTAVILPIAMNMSLIKIFRYVVKHPESLSGSMEMSLQLAHYQLSSYFLYLSGVPLLLIQLFQPNSFTTGCLLGVLSLAYSMRRSSKIGK